MQALLFENPVLLLAVMAVVEFVLVWLWARRRTPRSSRLALAGLLLTPALLGLQALVVTDRERITAVCRQMADAMDAGEVPGVTAHVAPTFAAGGLTRDGLDEALTRVLSRVRVEEPRLSDFEIEVKGETARASFQASCRLVTESAIESGMISRWELVLQRLAGQWQVTEIRPLPTPWFPFRSIDEVLRAR